MTTTTTLFHLLFNVVNHGVAWLKHKINIKQLNNKFMIIIKTQQGGEEEEEGEGEREEEQQQDTNGNGDIYNTTSLVLIMFMMIISVDGGDQSVPMYNNYYNCCNKISILT